MADRATFSMLVRDRAPAWRRTAFLICGNWAHAEDLTQSVLLRMYLRWPSIDPNGVDAYARVAIARLAVDESRRPHRRREVSSEQLPDRGADTASPDEAMDVRRALTGLPRGQRATLVLRYYAGFSVAETAAALGVTEGTVKSQTAKGIAALRERLGAAPVGETDGRGAR